MVTVHKAEIDNLIAFINANYGIDFSNRRAFLVQRAEKAMVRHGYDNFTACFDFICTDFSGRLLADFISGITVNIAFFCPDPAYFDFFKAECLKKYASPHPLRLWSAGCGTGEEAYMLAMLCADESNSALQADILATDISTTALERARQGVYALPSIGNLPADWQTRFFTPLKDDPEWVNIAPEIKSKVIFKKHNLAADAFDFSEKHHAIFCRDVMMYFDEKTKHALLAHFYDALEEGGYLFLGESETLKEGDSDFKYIKPSVYQKPKL